MNHNNARTPSGPEPRLELLKQDMIHEPPLLRVYREAIESPGLPTGASWVNLSTLGVLGLVDQPQGLGRRGRSDDPVKVAADLPTEGGDRVGTGIRPGPARRGRATGQSVDLLHDRVDRVPELLRQFGKREDGHGPILGRGRDRSQSLQEAGLGLGEGRLQLQPLLPEHPEHLGVLLGRLAGLDLGPTGGLNLGHFGHTGIPDDTVEVHHVNPTFLAGYSRLETQSLLEFHSDPDYRDLKGLRGFRPNQARFATIFSKSSANTWIPVIGISRRNVPRG